MTMPAQPWYEIIGFSLIGPPPLGAVHLKWEPGIHVLYGRNGAGKSRLLETLLSFERRRGLTDSKAFLHIRYDPDGRFDVDGETALERLGSIIGEATNQSLPELAAANDVYGSPKAEGLEVFFSKEFLGSTLGELIETAIDPTAWLDGSNALDGAEAELFSSHTLSIEPEAGVWVSTLVGEQTPILNEILTAMRNARLSRYQSTVRLFGHYVRQPWATLSDWPNWAPIPLRLLASDPHRLELIRINSSSGDDPEEGSNETARSLLQAMIGSGAADESTALEILDAFLEAWSSGASESFRSLMIDAPSLMIERLPMADWFEGRIVGWNAMDEFLQDWLPLFAMSDAQQKWADVAIYLALTELTKGQQSKSTTAVIVDEPEQALHPAAIGYLLDELAGAARRLDGPVFLASHSPQVLGLEGARLLHVVRDQGGLTSVVELAESLVGDLDETAERLGLRKVDLLQLYRVFLIVEGMHDSTVLEAVFPGRWESNRIRMVHMRGSSHVLDLASSEIVRDFSEANLVVLLDDVEASVAGEIQEALSDAGDGRSAEAEQILKNVESRAGASEFYAAQLARGFLKQPLRLHIRGLEEKDIIEYLDPASFGLNERWGKLRTEHRGVRAITPDFKEWLRSAKGARINARTIGEAAMKLRDHPPSEFTEILDVCIALANGKWHRSPTEPMEEE